jgi:N-acetylmuramic acid 6-phosphate etherase
VTYEEASQAFETAGRDVKTAIVMLAAGVPADEARKRLEQVGGIARLAVARGKNG